MTARTWTREQTETTLEALAYGGAPWYADVLDAYEDLIGVLTIALESAGSLEHCQDCPGFGAANDEWGPCQLYAEHVAYHLLKILGKVN